MEEDIQPPRPDPGVVYLGPGKRSPLETDMDMFTDVEMESLLSPCKRLKLGPPLLSSTCVSVQEPVNTSIPAGNDNGESQESDTDSGTAITVVPRASNVVCNTVPICSSTPCAPAKRGLTMRDMNVLVEEADKELHKKLFVHGVEFSAIEADVYTCVNGRTEVDTCKACKTVKQGNDVESHKNKSCTKDGKPVWKDTKFVRDKKDRKTLKRVEVETFKEYLGPGLTASITSVVDADKEIKQLETDSAKQTDVESCLLSEYMGPGLTGPVEGGSESAVPKLPQGQGMKSPNIPLDSDFVNKKKVNFAPQQLGSASTCSSLPSLTSNGGVDGIVVVNNDGKGSVNQIYAALHEVRQSASASNLSQGRPVTNSFGQAHVGFAPCVSGSVVTGNEQHMAGAAHGFCSTGSLLSSKQSVSASTSGQFTSGTSSVLQPDDVYPGLANSRGENRSNSKGDKRSTSAKAEAGFNPKVLQSEGQLKVSAYMNFGLMTVHVIQGRQLSTKWKNSCDSFVKMSLVPDDGKKPKCRTEIVVDSNNPVYDEKFSFELDEEDHGKRLMISVWNRELNASVNEFLGCMSFGIRHLTNPRKEVSGWYYLLTEDIGRKKHLQVSHRQKPHLKVRNHSNIPAVNKDVWGTESLELTLRRGKNGFGFSVIEACPVRVGRVDGSSPAESAGLLPGDIIVRLNKQNVSRSTATSVAKLVKHSGNPLNIEVQRRKPVTFENLENSMWQTAPSVPGMPEDLERTLPPMYMLNEDDVKENEISVDDVNRDIFMNPTMACLATSTPLPLLAKGHQTVRTIEVCKQEAIHRLLSLELDYIDVMHAGMQRYSRPLRHCILSHAHHATLFQNIEKLTTIAEYLIKQMHDNAPSSFMSDDTDTSVTSDNHNFVHSIGLIYQSKVHMLCQAYALYAKGINAANQLLTDLRRSEDFIKFVKEPPLEGRQPSISQFIYQPIQHIRELYKVIQEIFINTSPDAQDYTSLRQVVEGLQECTNNIRNSDCERVESISSLASRDSRASCSSSMKSKSSSGSSSGSSRPGRLQSSCSLQTVRSVDAEVMKIQDRLVFASTIPVFQLCQDDRHVIFSGDMYKWQGHQWVKLHAILFTDMLLETRREPDGYLKVIQEPLMLKDITGMDAQRKHGTEFVLHCNQKTQSFRKLSLRAPSTEQKYAWKSLIEQRVFAVRGTMEYFSSTSDVSSNSASAIII